MKIRFGLAEPLQERDEGRVDAFRFDRVSDITEQLEALTVSGMNVVPINIVPWYM